MVEGYFKVEVSIGGVKPQPTPWLKGRNFRTPRNPYGEQWTKHFQHDTLQAGHFEVLWSPELVGTEKSVP